MEQDKGYKELRVVLEKLPEQLPVKRKVYEVPEPSKNTKKVADAEKVVVAPKISFFPEVVNLSNFKIPKLSNNVKPGFKEVSTNTPKVQMCDKSVQASKRVYKELMKNDKKLEKSKEKKIEQNKERKREKKRDKIRKLEGKEKVVFNARRKIKNWENFQRKVRDRAKVEREKPDSEEKRKTMLELTEMFQKVDKLIKELEKSIESDSLSKDKFEEIRVNAPKNKVI